MHVSSSAIALDDIVVGGGIGGLSAAIALGRAGHHVTVYERYPADADAGAGIVVASNGARVLKQWGLDLESVGMLKFQAGYVIQGNTLELLEILYGSESKMNREEDNGEAQYSTTRQDLRALLRKEAEKQAAGEGTIQFRYDVQVTDYDVARPAVKLADTWIGCDLVIACDGHRSKAARIVWENKSRVEPLGMSAFRLLVPTERLKNVKEKYGDDEFIQKRFGQDSGHIWFARDVRKLIVWWTCNFGQTQAMDLLVPDNGKYLSREDWTARSDKQILLNEVENWHPVFRDIFEAAEQDPLLWKICFWEPQETMYKGKVCLLGDALHPMPPFRGQGATQSIEDAGALEMVLSDIQDKSELATRLELLQKLRVPRYAPVQVMSTVRQDEINFAERFVEVLGQCRKWFTDKDQSHLDNPAAFNKWMLSYDVREAAMKAVGTCDRP